MRRNNGKGKGGGGVPRGPVPDGVVAESARILEEIPLCDSCLGRMYARRLRRVSSARLGGKIKALAGYRGTAECHVCRDILDRLHPYVERMESVSRRTHHSSFLVGAVLKPSVLDRDDALRSRFKMRGVDGIKGEVTGWLTRSFAKRTGKVADHLDPDLTFLVDLRTGACEHRTKSLVVSGRYTKAVRGLPQRQRPCEDCGGGGCAFCGNHGIAGFDSVEGVIARFLYGVFGCPQVRFSWVGGEDRDSLVGGGGRPFFARIINPAKRRARLGRGAELGGVSLHCMKRIACVPAAPVRFRSRVALQVRVEDGNVTPGLLSGLDRLAGGPVTFTPKGGRPVQRRIHSVGTGGISGDSFSLVILADGGIPMKKLVEGGDGDGGGRLSPSVSEILGSRCTCVRFDFEDILVDGGPQPPR